MSYTPWTYNAGRKASQVNVLESNRLRKTGSRDNDTLSCVGKLNWGSVTMSQCHKNTGLIPLLTMRFSAKTALAGIRVELRTISIAILLLDTYRGNFRYRPALNRITAW